MTKRLFAAILQAFFPLIVVAGLTGVAQATIVVTKSVDGQAGPWDQLPNPLFDYGAHDNLAPTVFSSVDGLTFNAGDTLSIAYISGLTSAFLNAPPSVDGNGYVGSPFKNDDPGSSGNHFPSFYMGPYPPDIFLNALVGTFADAAGVIVGNPFAVDNGPLTVVVPIGAFQLQLGVNDDVFSDNTGSLLVSVTEPAPEPGSLTLAGIGIASVLGFGALRRRKSANA